MNKEVIIKLLNECLSSDSKEIDKMKLQEVIRLLESIMVDTSKLRELVFDDMKKCCQITEEDIQELSFYRIMCEIQDMDYQLNADQIRRVKELLNIYLKEIKVKLVLIDKNQEKDNYLRRIIEKIKQDKFVLSSDELLNINKLLKEKKVEILQINQIMIYLSLMVISELERQLSYNDVLEEDIQEEIVQEFVKKPVETMPRKTTNKVTVEDANLSKDEFFDKLWDLLNTYGCELFSQKFVSRYTDEMMKERASIYNIEDVLRTLKEFGIKLTLDDYNKSSMRIKELICHSSGEVIRNILKITTKLSGLDNQSCFNTLFPHIAIFMKDGKNSAYQDFMKNMCMFEELNITPEQFMMIDEEVLCISHSRLRKNILTLEKYKIPKETYLSSITVLKTSLNLNNELDMWLELGTLESDAYLNRRLAVLVNNHIPDFGKKLRIFRDLGLNITIKERGISLNKWLFEQIDLMGEEKVIKFNNARYEVRFVPYEIKNEEYDNIMSEKGIDKLEDKASKCALYQKFINSLECIKDLYYYIPDVSIKISKNKVYRVFNKLINSGVSESREMLIYAIAYKSVIDEQEYMSICKFVDQLLENDLEHKGSVR